MKSIPLVSFVILLSAMTAAADEKPAAVPDVVLAVHGGLAFPRDEVNAELEKELRAALDAALKEGYKVLQDSDATSLDAVEASIKLMEDSPLFNAGKGAVFTHEGRNELDASIMEGKAKRAGAVAGVTIVKNPISAARAVMEKSKHVMLIGRGAEVFATQAGLEIVDPSYFWTLPRWQQIERQWQERREPGDRSQRKPLPGESKPHWGTVGAVALDSDGTLAAGTSTGGISNKRFGRVGDSPIIGAGTYADNESCAISCTGHGEYFIRFAVAHEISSLMKYKRLPVEQAVDQVVNHTLKDAGGDGGLIALDARGRYSAATNTEGLYRGYITTDGKIRVMLYAD